MPVRARSRAGERFVRVTVQVAGATGQRGAQDALVEVDPHRTSRYAVQSIERAHFGGELHRDRERSIGRRCVGAVPEIGDHEVLVSLVVPEESQQRVFFLQASV